MSHVKLLVYDLSEDYGRIEKLTQWIPGVTFKGIWHTSLILYGKEIEYGKKGVTIRDEGEEKTKPIEEYNLGFTHVPYKRILGLSTMLGKTHFKGENYNVIKNNCHCFTNTMVKNLMGKEIPEYLRDLPKDGIIAAIANSIATGLSSNLVQESTGITKNQSNIFKYLIKESAVSTTHKENVSH